MKTTGHKKTRYEANTTGNPNNQRHKNLLKLKVGTL